MIPLSASFSIPTICVSLNRDRFMGTSRLQYAEKLHFSLVYSEGKLTMTDRAHTQVCRHTRRREAFSLRLIHIRHHELLSRHEIHDDRPVIEAFLREIIVKRCMGDILAEPVGIKCNSALHGFRECTVKDPAGVFGSIV